MIKLNQCTCGQIPLLNAELWNPYPKSYFIECRCGERTNNHISPDKAIEEWNEKGGAE